jgi:sporulation protein YlmC with PRC-barrel domain
MPHAKATPVIHTPNHHRILPTAGAALTAVALIAAAPALGQDQQTDSTWVDIQTWDTAYLYEGWSAEALLQEDVYGAEGDVIGEVEDFIVGPDGNIQKVVVEGGGFLDIGDSHLAVPWDQVERVGTEGITTPIEDGNLDEFGLFENVEDMPAEPPNFRLSNMLYDYVTADGVGYGTVDDVIFSEDGRIEAVVARPAYGYGYGTGPYAVPYAPGVYNPYSPYYDTPYAVEELADLRPFDYREFE